MFNAACVSGGRTEPDDPRDPTDPTDPTPVPDPTDPDKNDSDGEEEGDETDKDEKDKDEDSDDDTEKLIDEDVTEAEDESSFSLWIIIGIIAVVLCLIGFISFKIWRRRRTEFKVKTT